MNKPKIRAISPSPNGLFALMEDGRLFERIRDPKPSSHFQSSERWIWVEREGPKGEE